MNFDRDLSPSTTETLDSNDNSHLDVHIGPRKGPRWGGSIPAFTQARMQAIRERREYLAALARGELANLLDGGDLGKLDVTLGLGPLALALALTLVGQQLRNPELLDEDALAMLQARPLNLEPLFDDAGMATRTHDSRIVTLFVAAHEAGFTGVIVNHHELADASGIPRGTVRRRVAELLDVGLLVRVPVFRCHAHNRIDCGYCPGASSSRAANAYAVHPYVLRGIAHARASLLKFEQASSMGLSPESAAPSGLADSERESSVRKKCLLNPVDNSEPAAPAVVGPTTTTGAIRPASADKSSSAGLRAPEGESPEALLEAELARQAAAGNAFAAEELADRQRKRARLAQYGRKGGAS